MFPIYRKLRHYLNETDIPTKKDRTSSEFSLRKKRRGVRMTAAAIMQRKLARIAGLLSKEANPERLTSLRFKHAILEAANAPESLKIAALELLTSLGNHPIKSLEEKKMVLKTLSQIKKVFY